MTDTARRDELAVNLARVRDRIATRASRPAGNRTTSRWWSLPSSSRPPTCGCWPTSVSPTSVRTCTRKPRRRSASAPGSTCAGTSWRAPEQQGGQGGVVRRRRGDSRPAQAGQWPATGAHNRSHAVECLLQVSLDPPGHGDARFGADAGQLPALAAAVAAAEQSAASGADGGRPARRGSARGVRPAGRDRRGVPGRSPRRHLAFCRPRCSSTGCRGCSSASTARSPTCCWPTACTWSRSARLRRRRPAARPPAADRVGGGHRPGVRAARHGRRRCRHDRGGHRLGSRHTGGAAGSAARCTRRRCTCPGPEASRRWPRSTRPACCAPCTGWSGSSTGPAVRCPGCAAWPRPAISAGPTRVASLVTISCFTHRSVLMAYRDVTFTDELLSDGSVHRRFSDGREEWRWRGHGGLVHWRDNAGGSGTDEALGGRIIKRTFADGRVLYGRDQGYGRTAWGDRSLTVNRTSFGGRVGRLLAAAGAGFALGAIIAPPLALSRDRGGRAAAPAAQAQSSSSDGGGDGGAATARGPTTTAATPATTSAECREVTDATTVGRPVGGAAAAGRAGLRGRARAGRRPHGRRRGHPPQWTHAARRARRHGTGRLLRHRTSAAGLAKLGTEGLRRADGMFVLAIADGDDLVLVRDHVGTRTVFYGYGEAGWCASTSLLALRRAPSLRAGLNLDAVRSFLTFAYLPGDETLVSGRARGAAGAGAAVAAGRVHSGRDVLGTARSGSSRPTTTRGGCGRCWRRRPRAGCRPANRWACCCPGGIDSSLVTALAAKLHDHTVRTYSISFGSELPNELAYSGLVAAHCHTTHTVLAVPGEADRRPAGRDRGAARQPGRRPAHRAEPVARRGGRGRRPRGGAQRRGRRPGVRRPEEPADAHLRDAPRGPGTGRPRHRVPATRTASATTTCRRSSRRPAARAAARRRWNGSWRPTSTDRWTRC